LEGLEIVVDAQLDAAIASVPVPGVDFA